MASSAPSPDVVETSALEICRRSPEAVLAEDRDRWLSLFTEDACVEDPVGAGVHVGPERLRSFWDAFIAPQRRIVFHPRRDFACGEWVIRYVRIATVTPVSDEPFEIPALVEYRVQGDRVASLRAFWEPRLAVSWHLRRGVRGLAGLTRHGFRTTFGLGLGSALSFGRSLRPVISRRRARELASRLADAIRLGSLDAWLELTEHAAVHVGAGETFHTDPAGAWERALRELPPLIPVEVIAAGDFAAFVLAGEEADEGPALAALMRVSGGRPAHVRILVH